MSREVAKAAVRAHRPAARIMIVDDHPLVRKALAELISSEPNLEVAGEAGDVADALQQLDSCHPDLVIIDISLAKGNGLELIKQIKARDPEIKMLVSSMHDESLYAERALRAGAKGYINKQAAMDQVIEAVRQILRGGIFLSSRMSGRMLDRIIGGRGEPSLSPIETLSDRELEVFQLIGRGLTTRDIAARIHLSTKTVETYRQHIKAKLKLKNSNELVQRAVTWILEST